MTSGFSGGWIRGDSFIFPNDPFDVVLIRFLGIESEFDLSSSLCILYDVDISDNESIVDGDVIVGGDSGTEYMWVCWCEFGNGVDVRGSAVLMGIVWNVESGIGSNCVCEVEGGETAEYQVHIVTSHRIGLNNLGGQSVSGDLELRSH